MSPFCLRAAAAATLVALCGAPAFAADATADFSLASNPNGVWSYGWSTSVGAAFTPFELSSSIGGAYDVWSTNVTPDLSAGKAGAGGFTCCGTVSIEPLTMSMHPGAAGQVSIVRYTTASAGTYSISAAFWGQNFVGPTSTDVHVRVDSGDLFTGYVAGFGSPSTQSYSGSWTLGANQTIDFIVGTGGNGHGYDSTGFRATVTAVPEPATTALWLAGVAVLGAAARRRRAG